jgi:hypothetical protein
MNLGLVPCACAALYGIEDRPHATADEAGSKVDGSSAADGSTSDGSGEDATQSDSPRVVFLTSAVFTPGTAQFNGLESADALCNAAASAPGVSPRVAGRQFLAWLSAGPTTPLTRFVHSTAPYVRPDGVNIALDWAGLTTTAHLNPIEDDEHGAAVDGGLVWTGTDPGGTLASDGVDASTYSATCDGWTSSADSDPVFGNANVANLGWTRAPGFGGICSQSAHLYCFEK